MKTPLHRAIPAVLVIALSSPIYAQAPATAPAAAPAESKAPAEVVPSKPPTTPAPGQKTVAVPDAKEALSPGTKAPPSTPAAERKAGIDALPEAGLDQVISALKQRYINP